jgi:hypothetical protein
MRGNGRNIFRLKNRCSCEEDLAVVRRNLGGAETLFRNFNFSFNAIRNVAKNRIRIMWSLKNMLYEIISVAEFANVFVQRYLLVNLYLTCT